MSDDGSVVELGSEPSENIPYIPQARNQFAMTRSKPLEKSGYTSLTMNLASASLTLSPYNSSR